MARGAEAKAYVVKKLREAFGDDYIGEYDKKHYVWAYEGGSKMQIAIAMTCPKSLVGNFSAESNEFDWEGSTVSNEPTSNYEPTKIDDEERARVAELMKKLGL